jgi:hypothetical protein
MTALSGTRFGGEAQQKSAGTGWFGGLTGFSYGNESDESAFKINSGLGRHRDSMLNVYQRPGLLLLSQLHFFIATQNAR